MSALSFLIDYKNIQLNIWKEIIQSLYIGDNINNLYNLTSSQIEKMKITLNYLSTQDQNNYEKILLELSCPDYKIVSDFLKKYNLLIKNQTPIHNLIDFDWSTSLILGTKEISNLKEPITTFSFQIENIKNGLPIIENKFIELNIEEAENLLKKIEDSRNPQKDLIQN